jgi:hypothetical protein
MSIVFAVLKVLSSTFAAKRAAKYRMSVIYLYPSVKKDSRTDIFACLGAPVKLFVIFPL